MNTEEDTCSIIYKVRHWEKFLLGYRQTHTFRRGPLRFSVTGDFDEPYSDRPYSAVFGVSIEWSRDDQSDLGLETSDRFWSEMFEGGVVEGTVGYRGRHVDIDKIKYEQVGRKEDDGLDAEKLIFRGQSEVHLKAVNDGEDRRWYVFNFTFQPPGELSEQCARFYADIFPGPRPPPSTSLLDDFESRTSTSTDVAFVASPTRQRPSPPPLFAQSTKLVSASPYLATLLKRSARTPPSRKALRSFDGRGDLDVLDSDSDEDPESLRDRDREPSYTNRRRKRLAAPSAEPQPKSSRSDSQAFPTHRRLELGSPFSDIAEELSATASPHLCVHTFQVEVPMCERVTLEAVLGYIYTKQISFAPLSLYGRSKVATFAAEQRKEHPGRPLPASCRSVYRLAERFGLEELCRLALAHFETQIKNGPPSVLARLAISRDCRDYPDFREIVHKRFKIEKSDAEEHLRPQEDWQFTLCGRLLTLEHPQEEESASSDSDSDSDSDSE
ncbi:hypothetical protein JCM11491_006091 [Sporobolomyces phaffii]